MSIRGFVVLTAFVGVFAVAPLAASAAQSLSLDGNASALPGITVSATGTARATRMMVQLTFDLVTTSSSLQRAIDLSWKRYAELVADAEKSGASVELKTMTVPADSSAGLFGVPTHGKKAKTQSVSMELQATVASDAVASVERAAVTRGAQPPAFNQVVFVPSDRTELHDAASRAAIAQARERASVIAAADGRKLGALIAWHPSIVDMVKQAAEMANPFVSPLGQGEASVTVSGTATFAILP